MKLSSLLLILLTLASFGLQADDKTTTNPTTKTLVWPDGTRYVGGVKEGKRKGKGTIFWQDGTRFVGQFKNDMRNGPGKMTLPDGTVYTGLFKNDELVNTEPTIAARKKPEAELDKEESAAALKGTELPIEADSIGGKPTPTLPQVDKNKVLAPPSEPELTIAARESPEVKLDNEESTAALKGTELPIEADSLGSKPPPTLNQVDKNNVLDPESEPEPTAVIAKAPEREEKTVVSAKTRSKPIVLPESSPSEKRDYYSDEVNKITDSVKDELIETVDLWAAAWSDQNAPVYIANYSEDFSAPDRQSRRDWEALRKKRIMRPTNINLDIRYQRFELVDTDVVDVFFRQAYRSNNYSDLTDKVIRLRKEQKNWKILVERSM